MPVCLLCVHHCTVYLCFFFFNDTATTEIYTLSLHDALPISGGALAVVRSAARACPGPDSNRDALRHCPLKTACLPVSPPGRVAKARTPPGRNQAEHLASGLSGDTLHPMELWVAFAFGAAVGAFIGVVIGRYRAAAAAGRLSAARAPAPPPVQHVVLDEGSANVLNALNNRLAAIGALADLLHGSPLDPERARALMILHGEVRRGGGGTPPLPRPGGDPAGAARA